MDCDLFTFVRELPRAFPQIGAMLPSSPFLARAMLAPMGGDTRPVSVLEVGPGTGPFTREILRLMGPEDEFTICEINGRFMSALRRKLERSKDYLRHMDRVRFFEGDVLELARDRTASKFDYIISSLPFSNFTPETVDAIFGAYEEMLSEDGVLSFCEYIGLRKLGAVFSTSRGRERFEGIEEVVRKWRRDLSSSGQVETRISLLNVPPAFAVHFRH